MRAVAVLLVVLYHADLGPFRGGYIGVDVFFVVSGALITGLLADEVRLSGTVSLPRFWSRRARRLLPMSMLVLTATVVASRLTVDPLTQGFIRRAALAAIGFVANIVFWSRGGYSHLSVPDPLVHFWTLAVEEQFYLVWPLLVWTLARLRLAFIRVLAWSIATLGVASLVACIVLTSTRQPFAFYWLPTRAWELLAGAALVSAGPIVARSPAVLRAGAAWAGLIAIVVCAVSFGDPEAGFPGARALLPVVGTGLVMLGASPDAVGSPGRLLSIRALGWIGNRSYSLYLWHLPILVLAAVAWGPLSPMERVGAVAVAVAVSAVTFAFVEDPVRRSQWLSVRPGRSMVMGVSVAFVAVVVVVVTMRTASSTDTGVLAAAPVLVTAPGASAIDAATSVPGPASSTPSIAAVVAIDSSISSTSTSSSTGTGASTSTSTSSTSTTAATMPSAADAVATLAALNRPTLEAAVQSHVVPANLTPSIGAAYRDKPPIYADGCILGDDTSTPGDCVFGKADSTVTVVLFGDSHAAQWFSAMNTASLDNGWRLVVLTKMGCPTADVPVTNVVRRPECGPWRANALARIATLHPDLVVLSAYRYKGSDDTSWRAGLERTMTVLRPEAARVLVLGDTPTPRSDVPSCVAGHLRNVDMCMNTRDAAIRPGRLQAEAEVAAAHGADFVSTDDWLCTDAYCPVVIGDVLVYRDDSHLTTTAASLLTPYVAAMISPLVPSTCRSAGGRASRQWVSGLCRKGRRHDLLGGEEQFGERLECVHQLNELARLQTFIRLGSEFVGDRLDPLSHGVTRFAQPTVSTDQAASAHPVDHGGELRGGKVVDASELLCRHVHVEGEEHMRLEAADTLDHEGRDVPVASVLSQQRRCMEQPSHDIVWDRDRAQRGIHRPPLDRSADRRFDQQFGGPSKGGCVDTIAEDPP